MGLFSKIKNMFSKDETETTIKSDNSVEKELNKEEKNDNNTEINVEKEEKKNVKIYEKGLTKSRTGFVSNL